MKQGNTIEVAARNQLANARAHGQGDHEKAALKQLAALGVDVEEAGQARRQAAAEQGREQARATPPQGRTTAPRQTTAKRPPTSGPGSGVDAWRRYAAEVTGEPAETFADLSREDIIALVPSEDGD